MAALLPHFVMIKKLLMFNCTVAFCAAERLGFEPKFVVLETTVLPLTPSFYFSGHAGYGADGNRTRVQN